MPYIVGTAGHIDHGKTSLVKALTGQDTDRLKEEKDRGISIDLGFAHLDLPDGTSREAPELHVRAVEYTVGADGPSAMPASLPETSGYTHATGFDVDEE